jgi:hypothetical protein
MLQGWPLLAALGIGALVVSQKRNPDPNQSVAGGIHRRPLPPVRDPGGNIDPGRWSPGNLVPRGPVPGSGGIHFMGPPVPVGPSSWLPGADAREQPAGRHPVPWSGQPVAPPAPPATIFRPPVGLLPAAPMAPPGRFAVRPIQWAPTQDPGNIAHPTLTPTLPRAVDPWYVAAQAAANATPAQLRRIPDTPGPPPVGASWWDPSRAPGRGAMPWDASHIPVVQAVAPAPNPLPRSLPAPALGPGRGTGRHIPPPPPVARDPYGPTRTTLLPWDHPIAGPRMPELTGSKVPVTDAPQGAAAWYGLPARSGMVGPDPGVAATPNWWSTIASFLAPLRVAPRAAGGTADPVVAGRLGRAGAPW